MSLFTDYSIAITGNDSEVVTIGMRIEHSLHFAFFYVDVNIQGEKYNEQYLNT